MKIEVKISQDCNEIVTIEVEKPLFWSSGRPYTLEDYAIFNEIEKDKLTDFKII